MLASRLHSGATVGQDEFRQTVTSTRRDYNNTRDCTRIVIFIFFSQILGVEIGVQQTRPAVRAVGRHLRLRRNHQRGLRLPQSERTLGLHVGNDVRLPRFLGKHHRTRESRFLPGRRRISQVQHGENRIDENNLKIKK